MITPNSLGKQIAAKQAEEEAQHGPASFHHVIGSDRPFFIEFRPRSATRVGFAIAHICHYTLERNPDADRAAPERLTIGFSSADVMIFGARLGPVLDYLVAHRLDWVAAVDERYKNLSERPWVGRIDIQPYGKLPPASS